MRAYWAAIFCLTLVSAGTHGRALSAIQPLQAAGANDNRVAAGRLSGNELHVSLVAQAAMWYPDGEDNPGAPMQAFTEVGKAPQIPGPLIRVPLGTVVVASVRNSIPRTTLTMHGMMDRPAIYDRAVRIPYGTTRVIRFRAGVSGTYFYWGSTTGKALADRFGVDSQLNGALVVDDTTKKPPAQDRIFLISQWINVVKNGQPDFAYELDTINGRAWPHTERLSYSKNQTIRWRWVNASLGTHPLHLHGFYFSVDSRGNGIAENDYAKNTRDLEVTELSAPGTTFAMTWHADRPGNWLFHCHFAYHIMGHMPMSDMIAGKPAIGLDDHENYLRHAGMGGLILGLTIHDRSPHDPVLSAAIARHLHLTVEPAPDDAPNAPSFRYVVGDTKQSASDGGAGSLIVLTRGTPYAIDVTNRLKEATAVHWHGVELGDSFYDGVSGFSGAGERVAPMIEPGETFEAIVTPPRAGTFIYHTHMVDVWQVRGGLAAPLIVLEPGQQFDPSTDHVFTITTTHAVGLHILVNGVPKPSAITAQVGVAQRIRLINMTTFWPDATVSLVDGDRSLKWQPRQLDGADIPVDRRTPESAVSTITIGETRDFTFTPTKTGDLQLQFLPDPSVPNLVTVPIHVVENADVAAAQSHKP